MAVGSCRGHGLEPLSKKCMGTNRMSETEGTKSESSDEEFWEVSVYTQLMGRWGDICWLLLGSD